MLNVWTASIEDPDQPALSVQSGSPLVVKVIFSGN